MMRANMAPGAVLRPLVLLGIALTLSACTRVVGDDTDDQKGNRASGMNLYTDYGTGCQYVSHGDSLTPRLGPDGRQICKERRNAE